MHFVWLLNQTPPSDPWLYSMSLDGRQPSPQSCSYLGMAILLGHVLTVLASRPGRPSRPPIPRMMKTKTTILMRTERRLGNAKFEGKMSVGSEAGICGDTTTQNRFVNQSSKILVVEAIKVGCDCLAILPGSSLPRRGSPPWKQLTIVMTNQWQNSRGNQKCRSAWAWQITATTDSTDPSLLHHTPTWRRLKKTDLEYVLMNRRIPNTNQHIQETGGPQHCGRILRSDEVWCLSNFKHLFNVSQGVGSLLPRQVWKDHPDGWRNRKLMRRYEKQRILDIFFARCCQMLPGHEKLGVIWAGKMVVFTANAQRMCGFCGGVHFGPCPWVVLEALAPVNSIPHGCCLNTPLWWLPIATASNFQLLANNPSNGTPNPPIFHRKKQE